MENASKALLIAAAVLIVIALIAFAVKVFNSTSGIMDDVTPTADWLTLKTTVNTIDMQFSKYNGMQKGSTVKRMLDEVSAYNLSHGTYTDGGDESTTQLKRKISVQINREVIPAEYISNLGTEGNPSNTGFDNILKYKDFIKDDSYYNVKAREFLDFPKEDDDLPRKNAIYLIQIGFDK